MLQDELARLIAQRVSQLPPRQREVLVLTSYEGFTTAEVAETLGIQESNVYATLHVARQRLKRELDVYLRDGSRIADRGTGEQ